LGVATGRISEIVWCGKWVENEISKISPLLHCKNELTSLLIATLEDI